MESKTKVNIFGLSNDINFVRAKYCAQDIYTRYPEKLERPTVVQMLKFEWDTYIDQKKKELRGEMWGFKDRALIFVDGEAVGGPNDFIAWAAEHHSFFEFRPLPLYEVLTEEGYAEYLSTRKQKYVYMDIVIGGREIGRLVIELFTDLAPKTCANFEALCTGKKGVCPETHINLTYVNSVFHRVVPNGWIQGGDINSRHGTGGTSIYGPVFEDETFAVRHNQRGRVGMANSGKHSNHSQFYIILQPTPWMDEKYVAFGQLVDGWKTLNEMEQVATTNERPDVDILISHSGKF